MLELNRDYSIAEAAELSGGKVDDLIYAAADGRLQIYVRANSWTASRIYMTGSAQSLDGLIRVHRSTGPQSSLLNDDETTDQVDMTIGSKTFFGREGPSREVYRVPMDGRKPVASHCFGEFRRDPETAEIEIDFSKAQNLPNKDGALYFCPDPPLLVSDALKQGKLVVMADDLNKMLGQESGIQLADLYGHRYWPTELGVAIHAWMKVSADIQDGEKPGAKLRDWLKEYNRRVDAENKLSDSAIDRIATIANWDKSPGAARKKGLE